MSEIKMNELDKVVGGAGATKGKATVTCDTLNVRSSPNGEVIGHLHKGSTVNVISTKSGWCEIRFKNENAYVWKEYLKF